MIRWYRQAMRLEMTSLRGSSIKGVFSSESETHIFILTKMVFQEKAGKDQLADVKRIIYEPLAADEISSDFIIDNQQLFAKNLLTL